MFSGDKGGYKDSDEPDALDIYGKTKSLEQLVVVWPNPKVFHDWL